ncbi:MAG: hypothetical protein ACK55Z_24945 [bacterium]
MHTKTVMERLAGVRTCGLLILDVMASRASPWRRKELLRCAS